MKLKRTIWISFAIFSFFFTIGCSEDFVPKPKGYNKIELPSHAYVSLKDEHPYTFDYSAHAQVLKDSSSISEPHWIDIYYPTFKANIQITYKDVRDKRKKFEELIDDSHKLTQKHQIKAYSIDEGVLKTPHGYTGTVFELEGEVPSQFQFYVTDSTKHFLRGALYFRTATKNDSLAPVIEFIKKDVMRLINTVQFRP